jgi:hypothetical protein
MSENRAFVSSGMLRDFLEHLTDPNVLDQHELVTKLSASQLYVQPDAPISSTGAGGPGTDLARALAAFWRQRFLPSAVSPRLKRAWNTYLILEVLYFDPFVHGERPPDSLSAAGVILCDRARISAIRVSHDAEAAEAAEAWQAGNDAFWRAIVPANEIPSPQTLFARRDVALEKLAQELNRHVATRTPQPAASDAAYQPTELTRPASPTIPAPIQPAPVPASAHLAHNDPPPSNLQPRRWQPPEAERPAGLGLAAAELEAAGARLNWPALWTALELDVREGTSSQMREERLVLQALISQVQHPSDPLLRWQCAAALRQASLRPILEFTLAVPFVWRSQPVSALEAIAALAINRRLDDETQTLARAILLKEAFVKRLWGLDQTYVPLAHELTQVLGKQPYFSASTHTWELVAPRMEL